MTIVNVESPMTVVAVDETTLEVKMALSGVQGPAGPTGAQGPPGQDASAHQTYTHNQNVPSSTWTITHNLASYPAVAVVDSAGNVVYGDVQYISNNALTINFSGSFSGQAFLN